MHAYAADICLHEADLGEALLVDMVHHHNFIVVARWRAPGAASRDKHGEKQRNVQHVSQKDAIYSVSFAVICFFLTQMF